tara:strand:+ start:128747 stop:129334 length:588 start_codon:yes stop_codon:yes gene_type:complete
VTVKISFLILVLSISINTHAGDRIDGISGSMGKSLLNPFSRLFSKEPKDKDIVATDKQQSEDILEETKLQAEDDSASLPSEQEKISTDAALPEIDLISDINAEFEETFKKLAAAGAKPTVKSVRKKPTQLFIKDNSTIKATSESSSLHASNKISNVETSSDNCVKEKVYTLDVDNAAQYERLEDFPFTYECVIRR